MNKFQEVANIVRMRFFQEEKLEKARDPRSEEERINHNIRLDSLDWKVSVAKGLTDDLADFESLDEVRKFIERRKERMRKECHSAGVVACQTVLDEINKAF